MNALVTGGAGFIGSHLVEELVERRNDVTILDNFSSGSMKNIIKTLHSGERARLVSGDCKNAGDVRNAVRGAEVVFHFAANPEVRLDLADPFTCFQENIYATHVLLEAVKLSDVKKIVFASTSTVYGDAEVVPTPEHYSPLEPISIYGASKLASEALISSYCHSYKKKAVILRLANIVGPRSTRGVIRDFMNNLTRNQKELDILGDGHQTKSYLHVQDCVEAVLAASQVTNETVATYNVGSEDQVEVMEIAEIVVSEMNLKDVRYRPSGGVDGGRGWTGDVRNMQLDISRLKKLGWRPKQSSAEAIRATVRSILSDPAHTSQHQDR